MTQRDDHTQPVLTRRALTAAAFAAAAVSPLEARAADAPVRLTLWSWLPNLRKEVEMFEAANPDIRVDIVNAGQSAPEYAKLRTALKAGSGAPDVVQLELGMVPTFAEVKGLADLAPLGASADSGQFVDWAFRQVSTGPVIHALPWDSGPMGQIYREDIAAKLGFKPPATWAEFAETASRVRVTDKDAFLCNATFSDGGWTIGLLWQAGWRPFAVDGDNITIRIKDDVSTRFAAYWQKLLDAKTVDNAPGFTTDWYQGIARGRYAIWVTAAWGPVFLSQFAQSSAGKWRVAGIPQWDAAKPSNGNYGGSSLAVTNQSTHKPQAARLVRWLLTQPAPTLAFATDQFLFPVRKGLLDDQHFARTPYPFYGGQAINTVFAEAARQVGSDFEWPPFNDYFLAQMSNELGAAASGGGSLEGAFETLQNRIVRFARNQGFTVRT